MKMRKLPAIILSLILVFAIAACGETSITLADPGENGGTDNTTENSGRLIVSGADTETGRKITAHFMDLVEEYSNGTLICENLTDGELMDDRAKLELAINGSCDIVVGESSAFAEQLNDLYLYDLFYLFDNKDEVKKVGMEGETAQAIRDGFEEAGLKCLAMWDSGFHDLALTENALHDPDDFSGLRVGTSDSETIMYAWKALGADPIATGDSDAMESLQEWATDAQDDNVESLLKESVQTVSAYLIKTEHVYTPLVAVMNLERFNSLGEVQQRAVTDALAEAQRSSFNECDSYEAYAEKEFAKAGAEVTALSDEEKAAFREALSRTKCESRIRKRMTHPELLDSMKAELEAYREPQEENAQ